MFDAIIRGSLKNPWLVIAATLVLVGLGVNALRTMPVDVLPELAAPSVTVLTETGGMAPEEVEKLVTIPLEQALNGAPGLRRLRSSSAVGISMVWVEFDWDVPALVARQVVAEKLVSARSSLPRGIEPSMAPASSIMGEIMFVSLTGTVQLQTDGFGVNARFLRIEARQTEPGTPIDELGAELCLNPVSALLVCGTSAWHRGDVRLPSGRFSESTALYFGGTVGIGQVLTGAPKHLAD